MSNRIKTNIKFYKGLDNVEGRLYGFITKKHGAWRGCRKDEEKKKIVFVERDIAKDIIPNVLYQCSLIPMTNDGGFIAKTAKLVKFKGVITSSYSDGNYSVCVTFGNKKIIYNPASSDIHRTDIQDIAERLRNSIELEDALRVTEDFINDACMIKRLYEQKTLANV